MDKSLKKNIITGFLIAIFLLILFTVSEIIYTLNNDSKDLRKLVLQKSISLAMARKPEDSLNYLLWSAKIRSFYQLKKYNNIFENDEFDKNAEILRNSKDNKAAYADYIKSLDDNQIFASKDSDFLRIFYNLAKIAEERGNTSDILPFLKIAAIMEPELSHIHLEIYDYYLLKDDKIDALGQLDKCIKLQYPREHCQIYIDRAQDYIPHEIGFFGESIDQIYEQKPQ